MLHFDWWFPLSNLTQKCVCVFEHIIAYIRLSAIYFQSYGLRSIDCRTAPDRSILATKSKLNVRIESIKWNSSAIQFLLYSLKMSLFSLFYLVCLRRLKNVQYWKLICSCYSWHTLANVHFNCFFQSISATCVSSF